MKTTRIMAVAALIVASGLALHVALAQQVGNQAHRSPAARPERPGTRGRPGAIVELAPGATCPKAHASGRRDHLCPRRHVGIHGGGQAAGDPQGRRRPVHSGRNDPLARRTSAPAGAELATYVVEKGKPLLTVVK